MLWLTTTLLEISHVDVDPIFNLRVKVSGRMRRFVRAGDESMKLD